MELFDGFSLGKLICSYYTTNGYPNFRPVCTLGYKAGLWCHSSTDNHFCGKYEVLDA